MGNFINHKLLIAILLFLLSCCFIVFDCKATLSVDEIQNINPHISQYFRELINEVWKYNKPYLYDYLITNLDKGNTNVLYTMQVYTNNLLRYCFYISDYKILDDLIEINLPSYKYLVIDKDGYKKWIYKYTGNPELMFLVGKEHEESSRQYLYLISKMINVVVSIDQRYRTPKMNDFINKFSSVVINEHYLRWLPSSTLSLERKLIKWYSNKTSNVVNDKDLLLISGVAEIISANQKNPILVPMTNSQKESLLYFIDIASKLLESRMTESNLIDFNGKSVKGINFDLGMWTESPDYSYSGYTGSSFPSITDKKVSPNVGWNISHARRFVHVFDSLYESRTFTNQTFPDEIVMIGLTNQVVYGIFNRNFDLPLFTNFMDGSNGWYRVNYLNREQYGFGPYELSNSIPTGGYGFWSRYNPDMAKIMNAFWKMIKRSQIPGFNDEKFIHNKYYNSGYYKISNTPSNPLMFLPSMISFHNIKKFQKLDLNPGWNLFSINLVVDNNDIDSIFGSIKEEFSVLYTYDNINKLWLCYFPEYPYLSDKFTIDLGKGYWIYMKSKKNLTIEGLVPEGKSVSLKSGWNLVGYSSSEPEIVQSAMFSIYDQYSFIWTYDNERGWLNYVNIMIDDLNGKIETLLPGYGYWIFAKEDCIWDLDFIF